VHLGTINRFQYAIAIMRNALSYIFTTYIICYCLQAYIICIICYCLQALLRTNIYEIKITIRKKIIFCFKAENLF